jgi:hypothetical protein|eukprot:COSAG06_NODE_37_length_30537_cov_73.315658_22_plen_80_part_00
MLLLRCSYAVPARMQAGLAAYARWQQCVAQGKRYDAQNEEVRMWDDEVPTTRKRRPFLLRLSSSSFAVNFAWKKCDDHL